MTSQKTYPDRYRLALKALELRAEEELSELAPLDWDLSARPTRNNASDPEQKQYRAKSSIRSLELMGADDEDEM